MNKVEIVTIINLPDELDIAEYKRELAEVACTAIEEDLRKLLTAHYKKATWRVKG